MSIQLDDAATRSRLALWVCVAGVAGIAVISTVLLWQSDDADRPEMARLVFASVLPLLGTWIGTILAFYFAKENLQAASTTTLETLKAAGTFTDETKASDVMTQLAKISPVRHVLDRAAAEALVLRELYVAMRASQNARVPVLTNDGVALLVVHEPDVDKYAQLQGKPASDLADSDTLHELRATPELARAVDTFVAVGEAASVGDARTAMRGEPGCKDVFVTSNGSRSGKVIGWITNSDLARSA